MIFINFFVETEFAEITNYTIIVTSLQVTLFCIRLLIAFFFLIIVTVIIFFR